MMRNDVLKTPGRTKLKPISGLLSLTSSNQKKSLIKFLPRTNRKQILEIELDSGFIRRRDLSKFCSNVFQYFLYDNEVIPFPFQYFERAYQAKLEQFGSHKINKEENNESDSDDDFFEQSVKVFSNPLKPQVQKMYHELYDGFQRLDSIFDEILPLNCVKSIALGIGASIRFLKEIFIFDFSGLNIATQSCTTRQSKSQQIIVSLSSLVQVFFRKLIDTSSSTDDVKMNNSQKRKQNSVFVLAQINSAYTEIIENLHSSSSDSSNIQKNTQTFVPEVLDKIGSNGTRTMIFKLHHEELYNRQAVDDFEIFCDEDGIDSQTSSDKAKSYLDETEEIVECLTEEDEHELKNALNSLSRSESLSSLTSMTSDSSEKSDNLDNFIEERVWIELIPHVNCIAKI